MEIFEEVKEEILLKAREIGTKYFEYTKEMSFISYIDVELDNDGCQISLDYTSDRERSNSIHLSYDEFLDPKIFDKLIKRYDMIQAELAKQEEEKYQRKLKEKERSEREEYERLKKRFG